MSWLRLPERNTTTVREKFLFDGFCPGQFCIDGDFGEATYRNFSLATDKPRFQSENRIVCQINRIEIQRYIVTRLLSNLETHIFSRVKPNFLAVFIDASYFFETIGIKADSP